MNVERLIRDLDGKELTSGKLALAMAATADKKDWKLIARKVKRIEPNRDFIKPVRDNESAEYLADNLTRMFDGGEPKRGYLSERYPENVLIAPRCGCSSVSIATRQLVLPSCSTCRI